MKLLKETLQAIKPTDKGLFQRAWKHLDNLTKPKGSLGRLEEIAARLFVISDGQKPEVDPPRIYTCAGDHGVVKAGVSLFPQEVTRQMVINFLNGGAAINVLAKTCGVDLKVVDVGSKGPGYSEHENFIQKKIAQGTRDLSVEPAMSRDECVQAIELGIALSDQAKAEGIRCLGTGEMGIGNTTPSTALFCAYLGLDPYEITGAGTGLDGEGIRHKAEVIARGLKANEQVVVSGDPLGILAALGGLEIACLTGLILGAAKNKMSVVVDGFISSAAFVAAWKMNPHVLDYTFFSHVSAEKGHKKILQILKMEPILNLDMRLGEGTAAAMAIFILRCAANIFNDMATFEDAGVSRGN
ncbi:nicotinate-nucleotide--dimethylbenzimidazole phosphoribosyltransferase [Desulfovulcanus sp.]